MKIETIILEEAKKITSKYKIDQSEVERIIRGHLETFPELINKIESTQGKDQVYRFGDYKDFIKKVKREIYYSLRKYERVPETGAMPNSYEHISVKEREPYIADFMEQLIARSANVHNILDVGGGLFPMTVPFERFPNLGKYVWLDRDKKAYETLKELNNPKLFLYNGKIGEKPWADYLPEGTEIFDLALMIKLVSVVWRQERSLIEKLLQVPAKTILVTAPKEAMTRRQSVYRREKKVLLNFIKMGSFKVVGDLDVGNEFGYFIKK